MANLLGQNIGTNYKGILSLDSTINTPLDATLRAVTDGDGNASPLELSTDAVSLGGATGANWDNTNKRLGIGTNTPTASIEATTFKSSSINDNGTVLQFLPSYNMYTLSSFSIGAGDMTARLGVKGYGTTSATTALLVQNSASTNLFTVLDNGNVGIGTNTLSARLQVKGDGTNPIARFEDNSNVPMLRIENNFMRFGASTPFGSLQFPMSGTTFSANNNGTSLGFYSQFSIAASSDRFDFGFSGDTVANTAGTVSHLALVRNFAALAGSANYHPLSLNYTINNSGVQTGTATGIFLNATETNLNGMSHNLLDLQTGGVSKFKVTNTEVQIGSISGARLAVKGSGTTSATTALLVQNSAGVDMMKITDDITTTIGNQFNIIRTTVPSQLIEINANFSTIAAGIRAGGNSKDFILSAKDSRNLYLSTNFVSSITQVQFALKHNQGVFIADNASVAMAANTKLHIKGSGSTSATTSLLVQNSAGNTSLQVTDDQQVTGFSGTQLRFRFGTTSAGQGISTRDGQYSVGLIDASQSSALRLLALSSGSTYIDGYTEGASKATNYPLFIGSRANNTGISVTNSTTQENGTQTFFGSAVSYPSAIVGINSTTRGFLPPRMTTVQRNAIVTPAAGLMVYDTDANKLYLFTTLWEQITSL